MAVKTDVVLLADAGDVTVARRTAFYTYGKFEVILPEGREQQETDNRIEDGYIARAHDGDVGRFDFGFIRADATVNIDAGTSDLETQIDSAELRAEGDVFFEGDITPSGFNGFIPGVDYDSGDIVTVRRWGTSLALPVTSIELEVSESAGTRASRVHVSGQLIHDAASRRRSNDDLRQQIAAEKRERLRQVGAVDSKATQAKDTADEAKQATEDNRTYIDEQLDAAGVAVELGRQYLESMRQHVAAGTAQAGLAMSMASEANNYAQQAIDILNQLDPLRDDVTTAHAEVARLHGEASQFTDQAAEHVRLASQHAGDARGFAFSALAHEEEGRRQATAALNAAGAAQDSAALAQGILDDADGILSQVSGYSQQAKDALSDAESLLANAGGSGKSLGDVLLEVANKHQETLNAHDDILDLHSEVLEKHSEAIRYVAAAAAQAGTAAMHAAQAAQEALNVAADAARAAGSAADAADEAAQAASNNSAAIGKLEEADGKLVIADQKLQDQIDILEESQTLLAKAVQLLAGAVAQAAMAARNAGKAANYAGDAAGKALDAIDAMGDAIEARDAAGEAWRATQDAINDEQNELINQLKAQQEELVKVQNESVNVIMATQAGTSFPGVNTRTSSDGYDWEFTVPDTKGALAKIEYWNGSGSVKTLNQTQIGAIGSGGLVVRTYADRFIQVTWAKPRAIQRSISELSTTAFTPSQTSWRTVSGMIVVAGNRASQGYVTVKARWSAANRGSTYGVRLLINDVAQSPLYTSTLGPLTFLGDGQSTYTANFPNVSVPAGGTLKVQVYSTAGSSSSRRVNRVELTGSWIETQ